MTKLQNKNNITPEQMVKDLKILESIMGLLNTEDLNMDKVKEIKKATKKFEKHIQKTYPGYDKIKSEKLRNNLDIEK